MVNVPIIKNLNGAQVNILSLCVYTPILLLHSKGLNIAIIVTFCYYLPYNINALTYHRQAHLGKYRICAFWCPPC